VRSGAAVWHVWKLTLCLSFKRWVLLFAASGWTCGAAASACSVGLVSAPFAQPPRVAVAASALWWSWLRIGSAAAGLTPLQGLPAASTVDCHLHCFCRRPDRALMLKLQRHREQTAHLQAALLHSDWPVRAQIPTAQQDSIRSPLSSRRKQLRGYRVFLLPV
jgi:hypothetical protein